MGFCTAWDLTGEVEVLKGLTENTAWSRLPLIDHTVVFGHPASRLNEPLCSAMEFRDETEFETTTTKAIWSWLVGWHKYFSKVKTVEKLRRHSSFESFNGRQFISRWLLSKKVRESVLLPKFYKHLVGCCFHQLKGGENYQKEWAWTFLLAESLTYSWWHTMTGPSVYQKRWVISCIYAHK